VRDLNNNKINVVKLYSVNTVTSNKAVSLLLVLSLILLSPILLLSQTAVYVPFRLSESGTGTGAGTLWLGVNPSATACIDVTDTLRFSDGMKILEYELPPSPPAGNFDFRFIDAGQGCLGEGVKFDFRKYNSVSQGDTFLTKFQLGTGSKPFVVSWPAGLSAICDSMKMYEELMGIPLLKVNMLTSTRTSLTGTAQNLASFHVARYGVKPFPSTAPVATPLAKPANGATNVTAKPTFFEWDGSLGALQYFVELATDTSFTSIVRIDTLQVIFPNGAPNDSCMYKRTDLNYKTKYFWRVRAKNSFGLSPYSIIYSFTTQNPPTPSKPTLVYPDSGRTNVEQSPLLKWKKSLNSDTYHVLVATDTGFSAGAVVFQDTTITDTSKLVGPLVGGMVYYWKVRGKNVGGYGPFSNRFLFTTILFKPPKPTQIFPANNDTAVVVNPIFKWTKSIDAATYQLIVTDAADVEMFNDATITDTVKQVTLNNYSTYKWKVKAVNASGDSGFTAAWTFKTIIAIPAQPSLTFPVNGDSNIVLAPKLTWSNVPYAAYYDVEVSTIPAFTTLVYADSAGSPTEQLPELISFQRYYWRVRAHNYAGVSDYSTGWNFRTILIPPPPVLLLTPANNDTGIVPTPTLSWSAAVRAVKYHLQVSTDTSFNVKIFNDSNLTATSQGIGPLDTNTKYYWRVRGWNTAGFGNFSVTWNFKSLPQPAPGKTVLAYPPDAAPNIGLNPRLVWRKTQDAETYHLQVALDSAFVTKVFVDSTITDTSRLVGPTQLSQTTKYFWRVRAKNAAGIGAFSNIWRFRTLGDEPAQWLTPFVALETGMARDTIFFGINPKATYGIDDSLGEYELPPIQEGIFDLRWVSPPRRPGILGEGTRVNLNPFVNFTQIDTFKVRFQPGTGSYPMRLYWSQSFLSGICDSIKLRDSLAGSFINMRMDLNSSAVISNTSISSLLIIMWHPRPLGIKIVDQEMPEEFVLYQNYPNPFNPSTNIRFSIMQPAHTHLVVYNLLGEKVKELANNFFNPGTYSVEWNAENDNHQDVPGGVYFIKMETQMIDNQIGQVFSATQKMLLLK
jgi:hypothetical protein